jgi:hypothetical protein
VPGEIDPRYVRARATLLDALDALEAHREGLTLVGAQAVYLRTGPGDLVVAPFTDDGDLALDPALLSDEPLLEGAMRMGGFTPSDQPGTWVSGQGMHIDLLVPAALAGPANTRGAQIPPHSRLAARRAQGLEAALVDRTLEDITALDGADGRHQRIGVAGPAALIVAKAQKLGERAAGPARRVVAKDALDVHRLLLAYDVAPLADGFTRLLGDAKSRAATEQAITHLEGLFDEDRHAGADLVADALATVENRAEVIAASIGLVRRLLVAVWRAQ